VASGRDKGGHVLQAATTGTKFQADKTIVAIERGKTVYIIHETVVSFMITLARNE
jgi:hypothetical protein